MVGKKYSWNYKKLMGENDITLHKEFSWMKNFVITVIIKQVEAFLLFEMYSIPYGCNLKFVINH